MVPAIRPPRSGGPTSGAFLKRIDLSNSDQVAYYDDGVGTSEFKPLAVIGGAFGWGLKRNVLDLYKFACAECPP